VVYPGRPAKTGSSSLPSVVVDHGGGGGLTEEDDPDTTYNDPEEEGEINKKNIFKKKLKMHHL
jgi:hypothetical protein